MSALRSAYRRLRHRVNCALGRDLYFPAQRHVHTERHGSDYGSWSICPTLLDADAVVYSFGIGTDITFDLSLIRTHGLIVHAFDPTPGSIQYLEAQQLPSGFRWHRFGVGRDDGRARFFPPENPKHISHSLLARPATGAGAIEVEVRRLSTIMRDLGHPKVDLLKMDIEGAEYDVVDEIVDQRLPVRQILVEFHHRFPGVGVEHTRRAVERLNRAGYRIFFASDSGEEYSFILDEGARRPAAGNGVTAR